MLQILFSKYAIFFYLFVLNIEFLIKYCATISNERGKKKLLKLADIGSLFAGIFLVYYSYTTAWWAFIGLLMVNVFLYITIKFAVTIIKNAFSHSLHLSKKVSTGH
ncbi:MAG TPA: hypothetical protein VF623_06855 [Segetibacter sp.]|jgi:hypothetical protein